MSGQLAVVGFLLVPVSSALMIVDVLPWWRKRGER